MLSPFKRNLKPLLVVICLLSALLSKAQLQVDNAAPASDPNYLIKNVLVGEGVTISNITYSGNPQQFGTFKGAKDFLGFDEGIILSTGKVLDAVTDNEMDIPGDPGASGSFAGGTVSEADLIKLSQKTDQQLGINGGGGLLDLLVINFDFIPTSDSIVFRYVFASEEYPEWVNSKFNDVFGFFISGPGLSGDYTNGAENLAIVPGTNDLGVTVSSVHGPYNSFPPLNEQFYIDNPQNKFIEYDGYTTVFVVSAKVQPCQTYRLKIAIADKGSETYDSAVFLEAKSLSSPGLKVSESTFPKVQGANEMFEGCGRGEITITREWGLNETQSIDINLDPTSTADASDLIGIPTTVIFNPGEVKKTISFSAKQDGITEGDETFKLAVDYTNICSNTTISNEYIIKNFEPLQFKNPGIDTIYFYCPGREIDLVSDAFGAYGRYKYEWRSNGSLISTEDVLSITVSNVSRYDLTVSDTCNGGTIKKTFHIIPANSEALEVDAGNTKNISCKGTEVLLEPTVAKGGVGAYTYKWYLKTGEVLATAKRLQLTVTKDTQFFIDIKDECSTVATDSVYVLLANFQPLQVNISPKNSEICSGEEVTISATPSGGAGNFKYTWNYNNATTPTIKVKPNVDTEYRITVEDLCGTFRSASAYVKVDDIYAQFDIERTNDFDFKATNRSIGFDFALDETRWYLDTKLIGTSTVINFSLTDFDKHELKLLVKDRITDCTSEETYIITPPLNVFIPNCFTPNGDGVNDTFKVVAPEADSFTIYIFDRWGQEIWKSTDINEAWDGKSLRTGEIIKGILIARVKVGKGNDLREIITPIRIID